MKWEKKNYWCWRKSYDNGTKPILTGVVGTYRYPGMHTCRIPKFGRETVPAGLVQGYPGISTKYGSISTDKPSNISREFFFSNISREFFFCLSIVQNHSILVRKSILTIRTNRNWASGSKTNCACLPLEGGGTVYHLPLQIYTKCRSRLPHGKYHYLG